jgi:hypothetical protein
MRCHAAVSLIYGETVTVILAVLIFIAQPDGEPAASIPPRKTRD